MFCSRAPALPPSSHLMHFRPALFPSRRNFPGLKTAASPPHRSKRRLLRSHRSWRIKTKTCCWWSVQEPGVSALDKPAATAGSKFLEEEPTITTHKKQGADHSNKPWVKSLPFWDSLGHGFTRWSSKAPTALRKILRFRVQGSLFRFFPWWLCSSWFWFWFSYWTWRRQMQPPLNPHAHSAKHTTPSLSPHLNRIRCGTFACPHKQLQRSAQGTTCARFWIRKTVTSEASWMCIPDVINLEPEPVNEGEAEASEREDKMLGVMRRSWDIARNRRWNDYFMEGTTWAKRGRVTNQCNVLCGHSVHVCTSSVTRCFVHTPPSIAWELKVAFSPGWRSPIIPTLFRLPFIVLLPLRGWRRTCWRTIFLSSSRVNRKGTPRVH